MLNYILQSMECNILKLFFLSTIYFLLKCEFVSGMEISSRKIEAKWTKVKRSEVKANICDVLLIPILNRVTTCYLFLLNTKA